MTTHDEFNIVIAGEEQHIINMLVQNGGETINSNSFSYNALAKFCLRKYTGVITIPFGNQFSILIEFHEHVNLEGGFDHRVMSEILLRLNTQNILPEVLLSALCHSVDGIEAAKILGISKRTLDDLVAKGVFLGSYLIGTRRLYIAYFLALYKLNQVEIERQRIRNFAPVALPKYETAKKPELISEEKVIPEPRFIYTKPIELFTNVFVDENYLDSENATRMNDRFSRKPKQINEPIRWENNLNALMTFFFISDRLGYIDSKSSPLRDHKLTSEEINNTPSIDHRREIMKEIPYLIHVMAYYKVTMGSFCESAINREWGKINKAVLALCDQVNTITKKKTTRKDAIIYYFENKDTKFDLNVFKDENINIEMLGIMREIYPQIEKDKNSDK